MSRHRSISDLAALDDLPGQQRDAVRAHLADCPSCRRTLSLTREVLRQAREVTSPPAPPLLGRILERRAAGDRVILPAVATAAPRSRPLLPLAVGATLVVAVAIAAQMVVRRVPDRTAPLPIDTASSAEPATVGVAIVPARQPADVRIVGAPGIRVEVTLHDGPELGVRGRGAAADAGFRAAGGGILVTGVTGGLLDVRMPRGVRSRIFVNDRLEVTSDGAALRIERSGAVRARVTLDFGR